MQTDVREIEERRYAAITALKAMVDCLQATNPVTIFPSEKSGALDGTKAQTIANRWADRASDVLLQSLDLADRIGLDALNMFDGTPSPTSRESAERPGA